MSDRRLTPADAAWLYSEWEKNNQTVSALMWLDRQIDPADFLQIVQERMVDKYPTFHQRIRRSRNPLFMPYWEDDPEFDLGNHVEVIELPAPGDKAALAALISEQRGQLLDYARPLWKFYVIQGFEGDKTAIHARIQHAIADGWALVRLVMSLADESGVAPRPRTVDRERRRKRDVAGKAVSPALDAADAVRDTVTSAVGRAGDAVQAAADAVQAAAGKAVDVVTTVAKDPTSIGAVLASGQDSLGETLTLDIDPGRFLEFGSTITDQVAGQLSGVAEQADKARTAAAVTATGAKDAVDFINSPRPGKTILHGEVSGVKRVDWIDPIPMQPIKDIGRTVDATINDVLLGVLAQALRRYLVEKDALTVEDLFTAMPVSLRKPDEPLPRNLGNRFGLVPVLLPVGIADPLEQIREVKRRIDEIKASQLPVVSFGLISVASLATPDVERMIHKINQEHSIGVTTNVPGPRHGISVAGANVVGCWGMGGLSGHMNLSFGIFTLNGELNFAVHSDVALTPDPERILDHFLATIDDLKAATGVTG